MKCSTYLTILFTLLIVFALPAQKIEVEKLKGLKIRNIGPAGMSGRVTTIDVNLSDPDIIYIGTASGGVWKSMSGGIQWEPIFDKQPVQSIGALAINQSNPSEIWVGTGEGNPRNSQNSGEGIYKSIDGGKNWKLMGLEKTKTIHRVIINPKNPQIVYAAAQGSAWGPNEERGVYRTKDGGETWEKILYINDETGCADLVIDPSNPNKLIVAMWEYGRKPWTFNSGGKGSGIYVTHDGGDNWERRTAEDGLPKGILGRIGLAIAPSKPNVIYALIEAKENGFYKSVDGGFKWKKVAEKNIGNRPFYYADIFVDPQNENRVYNLWSRVSVSQDGGKTFERLIPNGLVHPDHHAFWVHPTDPNYLIEGNDGGLNISRDGGKNWRFVENLPLAQFYHISYDMDIPYHVGGGMQDNGSWVGPSSHWQRGGIRNTDWQEVFFGDGFDVGFRPDNNRYVYAMSQGGRLGYVDRETGYTRFIAPLHPEGVQLRFNWNAAFAQNPFQDCGIYYGSQFVHKSMDCGQSWTIISPDLTTNDPEKQKQNESGGLTIDDTRAENFTTIVSIAPSPVNEQVIWVGTDDGNLQITQDGGQSWTNLASKLSGARPGSWIPYIEVSQKNAGEAFIVVNDYRRNDWRPMVFHTNNFGLSFTRIVDEKQVHGHALAIVQDPVEPKLLWLGTDYGLYFSIDMGKNWNKWTNGFPSTPARDLKIHPREHDLIVGTFGRAAWILDDIRPFRALVRSKGKVIEEDFVVFEAPDAYLASFRSYDGLHFPADAYYMGQNRSRSAMLTLWLKPTEAKKEEKKEEEEQKKTGKKAKKKEAIIKVVNADGDTIRTFKSELKDGINRIYWNLRRDGVRYPSRREVKPGTPLPNGVSVLPGTYKLAISYDDWNGTTTVKVHADPRKGGYDVKDLEAIDATYTEFYSLVKKATEGFNQLKEARKTIKRVNEAMTNLPKDTKKEIGKLGKDLQEKIKELEKLYMQPEGLKGIQRVVTNLNGTLRTTSRYLAAYDAKPSQATQIMMDRSKIETKEVLDKVNTFMTSDFKHYQEKVEGMKYSLFKKMEVIELN